MDKDKELTRIKDGLYVGNHAVIITDQKATEPVIHRQTGDKGRDLPLGNKNWIEWGIRDDYPDQIEDLNSQEPVSSRCLDFKSKACIGQGLFWFRKVFQDGKEAHEPVDMNSPEVAEIRAFCDASNIDVVHRDFSLDVAWWDMCYAELITNKLKTKYTSMGRLDATFCRVAPKDPKNGISAEVHISTKFGQTRPLDKDITSIRMVDPSDPFKYPKSVYRAYRNSSRRIYYPKPSWHSTFGALDLALEAFKWIRSNLKNSKNIKYLIKVPWNYFLSRFKIEDYPDRQAWIDAIHADEKRLYKEMDDMLAGADNAMNSFKTKYGVDESGIPIEEFQIVPLTVDTQHQAWLPLYDTTAAAICSGHGVAPPLASIQVSSSMGASHGSTIRELFNFYVQFETTIPRQVVLEALNFVKRANKWPADIYPGFRNVILETLDNNKSGVRNEGEANPTTANKES
jgi:hypothetical protein